MCPSKKKKKAEVRILISYVGMHLLQLPFSVGLYEVAQTPNCKYVFYLSAAAELINCALVLVNLC